MWLDIFVKFANVRHFTVKIIVPFQVVFWSLENPKGRTELGIYILTEMWNDILEHFNETNAKLQTPDLCEFGTCFLLSLNLCIKRTEKI